MCTFIIAEAGVNHNGQADLAYELVNVAADAGADAIKFQTFSAEKVVQKAAAKAQYQVDATGIGSQYDMLKKLEMSPKLHKKLMEHCAARGIEFMSTPFDIDAANFLVGHGMRRVKVPSGEITNHIFLRHLAGLGRPIILSTGMATLDEVRDAVVTLEKNWTGYNSLKDSLTILHCTSNYPTDPKHVNLRAMGTLAHETGYEVGYSDHTLGIAICPAAVVAGAVVLEKHFTLDRTMEGPDHKASLEPDELVAMIQQVRVVEQALGSAEKVPTETEREMRILARRSITAARNLFPGDVLTTEDMVLLRPATGILPKHHDTILGRVVIRPVASGTAIVWDDIAGPVVS